MYLQTSRDIGLLVQERRRTLGVTQEELAERVGATRQWVRLLESGKPRLELGLTLRALRALGLALEAAPMAIEDAAAPAIITPPTAPRRRAPRKTHPHG